MAERATTPMTRSELITAWAIVAVIVLLVGGWIARTVMHHRSIANAVRVHCEAVEKASRQEMAEVDVSKAWPRDTAKWSGDDWLEVTQKVNKRCGDLMGNSSSEDSGTSAPQMSDCEQRIYNVTHSGVYSDEEENELIRAINEDPQCANR